jgi:diguanylate cyclase (GGDEF)-like protein
MLRAFAVTMLILAGIGLLVYRSIHGLIEEHNWVSHTHEVLAHLQDTRAAMKEVHADHRLFRLTGHVDNLTPFNAARMRATRNLERLRWLMRENSVQLANLEPLDVEVLQQLTRASSEQAAFKSSTDSPADDAQATRADLAKVHDLIRVLESEEKRLLEERRQSAEEASRTTLIASGCGLALCAGILMLVFWLTRRERLRREATEASLKSAKTELETSLAELKRIGETTNLIATMGDFLQSCQSAQEAYSILQRTLPRLLPGMSGTISIINNSRNLVEEVLAWGVRQNGENEFHPDECWGLRRGHMHQVASADKGDPLCQHVADNAENYLCLPMVAHGETLGVMTIFQLPPEGMGNAERKVIRAVAEQASLALANLRLQETLRMQSIRDPLTGLFNRRYLEASLDREVSRARRQHQPLSILMLDVDHFKHFNDTYGHEAGDSLLAEFGKLLGRHFRGEDIPCRYGGEEFCLLLPGADVEAARQRAEELRELVKRMNIHHGRQPLGQVTISVGVAAFPGHAETGEATLTAADAALYRAKRGGRDQVVTAVLPTLALVTAEEVTAESPPTPHAASS